jgi:ABC-type sugar transport system ATPase subunit
VIVFDQVSVRAGAFRLESVSFAIPAGAYAVLMGPTGSGKTTLLEALTGLKAVESGRIQVNGADVTRLKPALRGIGYVPQDLALFNEMTVGDNLAFALVVRRRVRAEVERRVAELAALLGLTGLLARRPGALSGGEKQRVALGRALAHQPATLCLDEPLSALDEDTRGQMRALLKRVQEVTRVTTLHVTHSREEAAALGDCLFRLEDGRLTPLTSEAVAGEPPAAGLLNASPKPGTLDSKPLREERP